jgi:hypothetical protein
MAKRAKDMYGRSRILPDVEGNANYALLIQDAQVDAFKVLVDGTVSQVPSFSLKQAKNPILDVIGDPTGEFAYTASLNKKNIDITRHKISDKTEVTLTIDQSTFTKMIGENLRLQIVTFPASSEENDDLTVVTVIEHRQDASAVSTFIGYAEFTKQQTGGFDLSKNKSIGDTAGLMTSVNILPGSKFGITTTKADGTDLVSFVCTSKFTQT